MASLIADNISFCYQQDEILNKVNLTIARGKILLLTGRSGCGKSTLCYLLAGIYPHHAGKISCGKVLINGQDIHQLPVAKRAKLVAMMFQNPNLQFCMDSVENELIFCLENIATPIGVIQEKIDYALNFCQIEHLRHRQLYSLSGGEKQLVMLACIIVLESQYIFLDEPFANLDPDTAKTISAKLLAYQQQKQVTLIIIDHQIAHFIDIVDELIILTTQGQILYRNINRQNLNRYANPLIELGIALPNHPYQRYKKPACSATTNQPLFILNKVKLNHKSDIVTRKFYTNRITAITGKSGSGKTTLLETLARMRCYQGSIQLIDNNTQKSYEISKIKLKHYAKEVGIVFQNPQDQFIANSVYEELSLSFGVSNKDKDQHHIKYYLQQFNLWQYRDLSPYMLSQGQQRLLAVTALLACNCKILLCDEPTYGLDRHTAARLMNLLQQKVESGSLSIIFTTHDQQLAQDYADDWYIFEESQLLDSKRESPIYA